MRAALPTTSVGSSDPRPTSWFGMLASKTAQLSGKPATFLLAALIVVLWAVTGPVFHYSDTWQLVVNTGTTIITFLMVFLIQNTQNRDTTALQLKLDELILATKAARNSVAGIEDATDEELDAAKDDVRERSSKNRLDEVSLAPQELGCESSIRAVVQSHTALDRQFFGVPSTIPSLCLRGHPDARCRPGRGQVWGRCRDAVPRKHCRTVIQRVTNQGFTHREDAGHDPGTWSRMSARSSGTRASEMKPPVTVRKESEPPRVPRVLYPSPENGE